MTHDQFYVGQRVKMYDEDDECNVYGHVKEIHPDRIVIKWNDLNEPTDHFKGEWPDIKVGNPS
jgi:hypothetical protein